MAVFSSFVREIFTTNMHHVEMMPARNIYLSKKMLFHKKVDAHNYMDTTKPNKCTYFNFVVHVYEYLKIK